jgi:multiple sugar transport system substrate-binding protein
MSEIELSIFVNREQSSTDLKALIQPVKASCQIRPVLWEDEWVWLTNTAVQRQGVDVSQVGSSTVSALVAMNVLRPFSDREVSFVGGQNTFAPAAWQNAYRISGTQVMALPWLADSRVVFYWKDLLKKAGVEEEGAFQNPEAVADTFDRLKTAGVPYAWTIPSKIGVAILQIAASWVWSSGGDFIDPGGRRTLFGETRALQALKQFFRLYRYLPQSTVHDDEQSVELFTSRQAAVTIGSPFLGTRIYQLLPPEQHERIGIALPPGPSFVGGSSLIVWKHTRHDREAVNLVHFLLSADAQREYCQRTGYLPVRKDVLIEPPFSTDRRFRVFALALSTGKPFSVVKSGGLLESRMATTLAKILGEIAAGAEIDSCVTTNLEQLAHRLDVTLGLY